VSVTRTTLLLLALGLTALPARAQDDVDARDSNGSASAPDASPPWAGRAKPSERRTPDGYAGVHVGADFVSGVSEFDDRETAASSIDFTAGVETRLLLPAGIPLGLIAGYQLNSGGSVEELEFDAGLEGSFDRSQANHQVDLAACAVIQVKGRRIVLYPFIGYTYRREVSEITEVEVDKNGANNALDSFLDSREAVTGHGLSLGMQFSFAVSESFGLDTSLTYTFFSTFELDPLEGPVSDLVESVDTTAHLLRLVARPWWELVDDHVYVGVRLELSRALVFEETLEVTVPGFGNVDAGFAESVVTRGSLGFEARFAF
jgi:hypothetical protein